jgi:amino acid adenylation domain-containing protein
MAGGAYLPVDEQEPEERRRLRLAECSLQLTWSPAGEIQLEEGPWRGVPEAAAEPAEVPAYLLYTSGSTGLPKGVMVPHRAIARLVCATDFVSIRPEDVLAFHSNLSFDASTFEIWGPLLNGASLVVTPLETVLSPEALAEHLRAFGITTLWLTMSLCAQLAEEAPDLFASLRTLIFGGEAADVATVRRICAHGRPRHLINGYGPTECTTFAVCHQVEETVEEMSQSGWRVPIGRPIANTEALVLDEDGQPSMEGELYLGGAGLALGYRGAPELTAQRFLETGFGRLYRTGDAARWREDGRLDYLGRLDRQMKIRGYRIEPGEVEAALGAVPGVGRAAVVRGNAPSGDPCLVAYFTGGADPEAVRRELRDRLPAQMVPAACIRVESLPLTANGKLDLHSLPAPFTTRQNTLEPSPGATVEELIEAAWRQVLGLEKAGLDDNFFDLGGTSLSLLRVFRLLHAQSAFSDLRVVSLFQHPTVRSLAAFLAAGRTGWSPTAARSRAEKRHTALARRRLSFER